VSPGSFSKRVRQARTGKGDNSIMARVKASSTTASAFKTMAAGFSRP
jgi:hypothetical protein